MQVNKNIIFLIGFMGCGKTSIGKRLAKIKSFKFIDLDILIEENQGKKIAKIFEENGEEYFRGLETETLMNLSKMQLDEHEGVVIATGGGCATRQNNVEIMKKNGIVIFIDSRFDQIYLRIANDKSRPLVTDKQSLANLFFKRRPIYIKSSHLKIKENRYPGKMAEKIAYKINLF